MIHNFPSKLEIFTKLREKNCISISAIGYEYGEKYPIYIPKNTFNKHEDSLLIEDEGKSHYVLLKGFKRFMHNQILNGDKKYFCHYCLQFLQLQKY